MKRKYTRFRYGTKKEQTLAIIASVVGRGSNFRALGMDPDWDDLENAELDAIDQATKAKERQP